MSCGTPKCASTRRPSAVSATACASVMHASDPSSDGVCGARSGWVARSSTRSVPPPGSARTATALSPSRRSTTRPSSTSRWSGLTIPDTTASPSPGLASSTARVRRPLTGSAVNSTPATCAATIRWTTTASRTSASSIPMSAR